MKTAIYIVDGTVQLVLTPEGEFENGAFKSIQGKTCTATIHEGSFYSGYECQGGWLRLGGREPERSLIIRVDTDK